MFWCAVVQKAWVRFSFKDIRLCDFCVHLKTKTVEGGKFIYDTYKITRARTETLGVAWPLKTCHVLTCG